MKLAFHRSITFWAGLLVMGFIVWAWRDSLGRFSVISWREVMLYHAAGGLLIGRDSTVDPFAPGPVPFQWERDSAPDWMMRESWPRPFLLRGQGSDEPLMPRFAEDEWTFRGVFEQSTSVQPTTDWVVFFPHWLILLVVIIAWVGLLGWRVKRRRKKCQVISDR